MKKIALLSALIIISGCSFSYSPAKDSALMQEDNSKLAEFTFDAPDTEDGDIHSWAKNRVEESLKGQKKLVRIPVVRNYGWGCAPPADYCLGLFSGGGCVYLKFTGDFQNLTEYENKCENASNPEEADKYCFEKWGLEGYFTGKTNEICGDPTEMQANGGSCCAEKDIEYEFSVSKSQPDINKDSDFIFKIIN